MTADDVREALRRKIELRWSEYQAELLQFPAAELFSRAGEIAAAQFCHEQLTEYLDCYAIEDLEYLLRFEDPLAVVRDQWASRQECDPSHEFKQMLADLQDENRTLQAKYELVYDLEAIEKQFLSDGTMVRPGAGQTVYLDLSGGDSVVYYEGAGEGLSGLLQRAEQFFAGLLP